MELPLVDGSMIEKPEVLWRYSMLTLQSLILYWHVYYNVVASCTAYGMITIMLIIEDYIGCNSIHVCVQLVKKPERVWSLLAH
jgi:hypothetical protein